MKEATVSLFDDRDLEIIEILQQLGQGRTTSRMIVFLLNQKEATSREIEIGADLRQPEVSVAARQLIEAGWVKVKSVTDPHVFGRSGKVYTLAISPRDIVKVFEDQLIWEEKAKTLAIGDLAKLLKI